MREIKFRAWDGERLRIVGGLGWVDGELDYVLTPKYGGAVDEDVEIMQFTGLKDKNDVEIYEGDVLQAKSIKNNNLFAVHYLTSEFVFMRQNTTIYRYYEIPWRDTEVIGNIYENPELLLND